MAWQGDFLIARSGFRLSPIPSACLTLIYPHDSVGEFSYSNKRFRILSPLPPCLFDFDILFRLGRAKYFCRKHPQRRHFFSANLRCSRKVSTATRGLKHKRFWKEVFLPKPYPTVKPRKQPYSPFDHLHTCVKITYHDYNKYKYLSHEHPMALYRYPQVLSCSLPTNQAYSDSHP